MQTKKAETRNVINSIKYKMSETNKNFQFGKLLKYYRLRNGLTQKQFAFMLQIPYQNYQRYEYGMIKPKQNRLNKICGIIDADRESLIMKYYI